MAKNRNVRALTIAYNLNMIITKQNLLNPHEKITKKQLAEMTGISNSSIISIMNGTSTPTLPHLIAIAKALNVSLDALLTEVEW